MCILLIGERFYEYSTRNCLGDVVLVMFNSYEVAYLRRLRDRSHCEFFPFSKKRQEKEQYLVLDCNSVFLRRSNRQYSVCVNAVKKGAVS